MPAPRVKLKIKSNSAAKKRLRQTGSGKIVRTGAGGNHLLLQKSRAGKKASKRISPMSPGENRKAKKLLPHL